MWVDSINKRKWFLAQCNSKCVLIMHCRVFVNLVTHSTKYGIPESIAENNHCISFHFAQSTNNLQILVCPVLQHWPCVRQSCLASLKIVLQNPTCFPKWKAFAQNKSRLDKFYILPVIPRTEKPQGTFCQLKAIDQTFPNMQSTNVTLWHKENKIQHFF